MTGHPPGPDLPAAPAVARNREPLLAVLRTVLPARGTVCEVASGTGEHAAFFAAALPGLDWQPTDRDLDALATIAAHRAASGLPNLRAPVRLDATVHPWPVEAADAVVSINMIHISPPASTEGLLAGAARLLPPGGPLVLYGPFREPGRPFAPSNAAFDARLRSRDPDWGVRDLAWVSERAAAHGLVRTERHDMPANNLTVVFRRD